MVGAKRIPSSAALRRRFHIRGTVQGVGFRPFVHFLATRMGLAGFVRNQSGLVEVEVEGPSELLDEFALRLTTDAPPLARIQSMDVYTIPAGHSAGFEIRPSGNTDAADVVISADVATCPDCLHELFDPRDRRYRYPFLNCTNCGPRLTIVLKAPYDRENTTMAAFRMCPSCQREYDDPSNRRFHAQPIACPECGPRLQVLDRDGREIRGVDPLNFTAEAIRTGQIVAIKGLGGFHLACDARNESAVASLRQRKQRDQKPFAVMMANVDQVKRTCEVTIAESHLLSSPQSPIVLLPRRSDNARREIADSVAPGNPDLGVMLPYTPLHHLLFEALDGCPLVMTSGNRSDEPIAYEDDDAIRRLNSIADLFLTHNRPIRVGCDDSVVRFESGRVAFVRRSRGDAPLPLSLSSSLRVPTLAVGGQLKSTFALGRGSTVILSQHLGDLYDFSAFQAFERDVALFEDLFRISPQLIVHDLHPDYASTRYAEQRAGRNGTPRLAVQHHHAHIAGCMAEHRLSGPVIGIAFDGTGYGTDGTVWGGEVLVATLAGFRRVAHLRRVPLPGGDAAIREPWRMAMAHLMDAGCDPNLFEGQVKADALKIVQQMISRRLNSPETSSMGRLFDAVSALARIRLEVNYEGQAAQELEWLAAQCSSVQMPYEFKCARGREEGTGVIEIDTRPIIRAIVDDVLSNVAKPIITRRFHNTIAVIVQCLCRELRSSLGLNEVVLSGGVFMNRVLSHEIVNQLKADRFAVFQHQSIPCNDGGLSFGQLAVAAAQLKQND